MKKTSLLLVFITIIYSCKQTNFKATSSLKAPIDSLISNWENNWNKHDSVAVRNMFLPNALLIDDDLVANGTEEFSKNWIQKNINVVNNLKTTKLQEWNSSDRAGYTGKFELDVIVNDSIVAKPKGAFSVNWFKNENGEWKIICAIIHSFKK